MRNDFTWKIQQQGKGEFPGKYECAKEDNEDIDGKPLNECDEDIDGDPCKSSKQLNAFAQLF